MRISWETIETNSDFSLLGLPNGEVLLAPARSSTPQPLLQIAMGGGVLECLSHLVERSDQVPDRPGAGLSPARAESPRSDAW